MKQKKYLSVIKTKEQENEMATIILLFLLFVFFVVPFAYIIIVDIIEISRRIYELYNLKLRPAVITVVNNIIR